MADKQTGTGARGKQNKPKGQGRSETGNHTKTSTDNRSGQVKDTNRSTDRTIITATQEADRFFI